MESKNYFLIHSPKTLVEDMMDSITKAETVRTRARSPTLPFALRCPARKRVLRHISKEILPDRARPASNDT